nr:hemerythrin family protein [Ramlibacter alkalitolerans]
MARSAGKVGGRSWSLEVSHWQESLRTCVPDIDQEHRFLYGLLARLDLSRATEAIDALHAFLQEHFVHEERLMDESSYPDRAEHRHQHAHLAARVEQLRASAAPWTMARLHAFRSLLSDWLEAHIAVHDKALALWHAAWTEYTRGPMPHKGVMETSMGQP